MYIVGNTETSSHVPMWGEVLGMLEEGGNVGTSLGLCCPRHPETLLIVTAPDDFSILPRLVFEGRQSHRIIPGVSSEL